jgi:hypothetical protein
VPDDVRDSYETRLRHVRAELDEVARQRDAQRLLRQSWHDQWRRDAELRHLAERDLAAARAALARARDLLEAWASCHGDPALERRTERITGEIDDALRPRDVW